MPAVVRLCPRFHPGAYGEAHVFPPVFLGSLNRTTAISIVACRTQRAAPLQLDGSREGSVNWEIRGRERDSIDYDGSDQNTDRKCTRAVCAVADGISARGRRKDGAV